MYLLNLFVGSSRRFFAPFSILIAIVLLVGCANYSSNTNTQPVSITISPTSASVQTGAMQQFSATVLYSSNTGVTWQVNGVTGGDSTHGTISASGLYTAPATVPSGTVTVTAIAQADTTKTSSATVTIMAAPPAITVTVSPKTPNVQVGLTQQFTATVANTSNTAVTWQVNGVTGGNSTVGVISASGLYTAPAVVPSPATVTVKAISQADNTKFDTATVTITAASSTTVAVSPKRAAITTSQTQAFSALVNGVPSTSITWEVDTFPGGNSSVGTITAGGVYTPPTTGGVHNVVARSQADPSVASPASPIAVTDLTGVLTYHNDNSRTGSNPKEYGLTTATVKTATFGKLFSCSVDAAVYTQPLWAANLSISGVTHNVVYATTQHDTVYAFDADSNANPCVPLWTASLIDSSHGATSGETWVSASDTSCTDLTPDIGIVGTPVIDLPSKTMYVVSKSKNGTTYHQRIHALDITTGAEKFSGPIEIMATVSGIGDGSVGGQITFDPLIHNQRSGLLLTNGHVIIVWAAHCDLGPYHGWVMSYSASTLTQEAVLNISPDGYADGIWMGGGGPAADSSGNIYFATGNGQFDANTGGRGYGDSIVKLNPPSAGTFSVASYFAPSNQATLSGSDTDLGSGGLVLLPDLPSGTHTQLLSQAGKDGALFVADRNALGGFSSTSNNVVQEILNAVSGGMWGAPAYWSGHIYFGAGSDQGADSPPTAPLRDFSFNATTGAVSLATTTTKIYSFPGPTPSVSSNGATPGTGILWAFDNVSWAHSCPTTQCQVVYAYDATNLGTELWDSGQATGNRDQSGGAVKFAVPTVANGKVYAGGQNSLTVFGLLPN